MLRRIHLDEPRVLFGHERSRNPFEWVLKPSVTGRFTVAIHTSGLRSLSADEQLILEHVTGLPAEHYRVFRTPGDPDPSLSRAREFSMVPTDGGMSVSLELGSSITKTGVRHVREFDGLAERYWGDRKWGIELVEAEAAKRLGAVVLVTKSPHLTDPARQWIRDLTILSPLEALPMLSAWDRARGQYTSGVMVTSAANYFSCLTGALTPNAEPTWMALQQGQFEFAHGEELLDLGQSCFTRLTSSLRILDRMYVLSQVPSDNHSRAEIADAWDQVVLLVAAIHDNLALLVGEYFEIHELQIHQRALHNRSFRARLAASTDARARYLEAYLGQHDAELRLHLELRHHAVHRARLESTLYVRQPEREVARMTVYQPLLGTLVALIERLGDAPAAWGLSNLMGPRQIHVSFLGQPNRRAVRHSPGEAMLDALPFATRLARLAARLIDDVFDRLDIAADPRLRAASALEEVPPAHWPARPEDASLLLLSSPMSGL